MNFETAFAMYEDMIFGDAPDKLIKDRSKCSDCDGKMSKVEGFPVCTECGVVDLEANNFVSDAAWVARKSLYKRRLYCQEKLKLMVGHKICTSPLYKQLVRTLKKKKGRIKSLIHLKQHLKDLGQRKMYKYIYNMYYDIKGVRLITLTSQQIGQLSTRFVVMESAFKQMDTSRKNFFNYSSMLYILFKKHKIKGYKNILLPLNHLHICKEIKTLIPRQ